MEAPAPKLRRFVPTPDRLVVCLPVLTGVLFLCEHFHCFTFEMHRGWTMLLSLASVAAFIVLMLLWFLGARLYRWRFQFSIRSLLVLAVAVALPLGWLTAEMKKAQEQRKALDEFQKLGASTVKVQVDRQVVRIDHSPDVPPLAARPAGPTWLRNLFGDDFFVEVVGVELCSSPVADADLKILKGLPALRDLGLSFTAVTDAGLQNLSGLTALECLSLNGTQVTDQGVAKLTGLTALQSLSLEGTMFTDARGAWLRKFFPHCHFAWTGGYRREDGP